MFLLLSSTSPSIKPKWSSLLELLDYEVKFYNDGIENHDNYRVESIKIPKKRRKFLSENGIKNCFIDNSEIYDLCQICRKTILDYKCHRFNKVRGICCHIVSPEHKLFDSINDILNALRAVERKSILDQLKMMGEFEQ